MRLSLRVFQAGFCAGLLGLTLPLLAQPTVSSLSPTPGTRNASRTSAVTATFNQPLNPSSAGGLQVFSARRGGRRTAATPATVTGSQLSFTPTAYAWQPGETVSASLTTRVVDANSQALTAPYVFQFTTAAGGTGQGNFLPPASNPDPAVAPQSRSVALGDIDGDGDLDLVTANPIFASAGTVSVRLNDGTGSYSAPAATPEVTVGNYPLTVVLGDVDGDGDLDMLTANMNPNGPGTVSVRLNTGTGSFSAPATSPEVAVGNHPLHLALGDVDGDGDLDFVTANETGSASIRLNSGLQSGIFVAPAANADITLGGSPKRVALSDIDGDYDLDLLVSNYGSGGLAGVNVLLNGGRNSGSFAAPATGAFISTSINPTTLALGDLDADGDLDLVVGTTGGANDLVNVRLNSGLGTFVAGANVSTTQSSVVLADVDADGDLDLVAGSSNSAGSVRLNTGSATFFAPAVNPNFPVSGFASGLAAGDLDGDGDLDVAVCGSGVVSIRLNQPTVVLPAPVITSFTPTRDLVGAAVTIYGTSFTGATSVQFNGTPAAFTVVSATTITTTVPAGATSGPLTVRTATGLATSPAAFTVVPPPTPPSLVITAQTPARNRANAPLNVGVAVTFSSPMQDIAATRSALRVYSAQRGGWLTGPTSVSGNTLRFDPSFSFKPGEQILATVTRGPRSIADSLFRQPYVYQFTTATAGDGRSYLRPGSEAGVGSYPSSVAMGDVDGDGDLDVVVANHHSNTVSVRLNGSGATGSNTGVFGGTQEVPTSKGPQLVTLSDVDKDGDLDLITACEGYTASMLSVRLNGGDATGSNTGLFAAGYDTIIYSDPFSLALGDINGDGNLDMVTADRASNYLSVFFSAGAGGAAYRLPSSGSPMGVVLGDIDGDGDQDLLSANGGAGSISIRLNGGDATGARPGIFPAAVSQELSPGYTPSRLLLGDIDGDGDLDLVAGNEHDAAQVVSMYLNGGNASGSNTGVFTPGTDLNLGGPPRSIALGDMDADGDLDLVTTFGFLSSTVRVSLNGGNASGSNTGVFSGGGSYSVGLSPMGVALGDVDGDGDLDAVTIGQSTSTLSVRLNTDGGGILNSSAASVCAGFNSGTLTLSYFAGTVVGYQADAGSGYQEVAGTTATLPFTNLTTTTTFRAKVLTPGGQTVYSVPVTVVVRPTPPAPVVTASTTGSPITLTSSAPAGNQWYRDGVLLPGATGVSYTLGATDFYGSYTVVATVNSCASAPSAAHIVTSTTRPLPGSTLTILPNPTPDGKLLLTLSGYRQPVELTVSTVLGQPVAFYRLPAGKTQQALDFGLLPAGVYILRVVTPGGVDTRRIVRE